LPGGTALARAYELAGGAACRPAALRLRGPTNWRVVRPVARWRCACAGLRTGGWCGLSPGGAALARAYGLAGGAACRPAALRLRGPTD